MIQEDNYDKFSYQEPELFVTMNEGFSLIK